MNCTLRISVYADETSSEANLLWMGESCVRCRKPLGRDGVVLFCICHEDSLGTREGFHSIHKTCLDGSPLDPLDEDRKRPVVLHESLQLEFWNASRH